MTGSQDWDYNGGIENDLRQKREKGSDRAPRRSHRFHYGSRDNLTSFETVSGFAKKYGAVLTVMESGEHWFHTEEQMRFLDDWIRSSLL